MRVKGTIVLDGDIRDVASEAALLRVAQPLANNPHPLDHPFNAAV
jgi:hypothetical protein